MNSRPVTKMEARLLARSDLRDAQTRFAMAWAASRAHAAVARVALDAFGEEGAPISGCVREHFPDAFKEALRALARLASDLSDAAYRAHRPRGVRFTTMTALARAVAARDGVGFYGPRP